MKNKGWYILSLLFILVIIFMFIFCYEWMAKGNGGKEGVGDIKNNDGIISADSKEIKVTPNTSIMAITSYTRCNHSIKEEASNKKLINKSREELEKIYIGWDIEEFGNERVVMKKVIDGMCDEHYVLRDNGGHVAIYKLDTQGNEILQETTGIATKYLTQADIAELENGRKIYGKELLSYALEDYE